MLEPEAMDTAEEAADYDAMDHSAVNAGFVADFLRPSTALSGGADPRRRHRDRAHPDQPGAGQDSNAGILGMDLARTHAGRGP